MQKVSAMYNQNACMVYNGTPLSGRDEIDRFLTTQVPRSSHNITYCDAQLINRSFLYNTQH